MLENILLGAAALAGVALLSMLFKYGSDGRPCEDIYADALTSIKRGETPEERPTIDRPKTSRELLQERNQLLEDILFEQRYANRLADLRMHDHFWNHHN